MYDEILGFIYVNIKPFSSTNSKIFNKQTQQLLVTSQQLLLNNLSFRSNWGRSAMITDAKNIKTFGASSYKEHFSIKQLLPGSSYSD
ncbi:hypothetical protein RI543_004370 [Arxiozyma heterogenica]|uniref:Uncharacterized protein n=1 Tax=Arxiozyma heterogenica TaxID=278026 RepID=A0AAN7W0A3_9SACH|nr:hypothetical protein RI543_004370 [Kazachstania heterogenica]